MPDLITLDLETPADPTTSEEPDDPAGPESASHAPASPEPATPQAHAPGLPYALTEVDGDPELDPGTPAPETTIPGAPSSPTTSPSAKVVASDPTQAQAAHPTTRSLLPSAQELHVHKARLQDARNIFDLVNSLSHDGTLLRRSYAEICENIRDFTIAETAPVPGASTGSAPHFLGCGALHLYGPHLAEVRSIVLYPEARGQGAGAALLHALLAESEDHGVATTCLFTRLPDFFERYGFRVAERNAMPDKIYKDCQACPRLYACDEVAMVKGPLPQTAVLGPIKVQQPELVQVQLHPVSTTHAQP